MSTLRRYISCSSAVVVLTISATAQTFTKITDPSNPVVTDEVESGGGVWWDVNKDGFPDLFVANGNLSNVNNALYLNLKNGNFKKVTSGSAVTDGGSSIGGTAADFDADGNSDLFVTNRNNFGNFLYRGTGDTLLTKITSGTPSTDIANSNTTSWVDLDNDGDLDLFTVNFQGNNFLYKNSGVPEYTFSRIDTGVIVADGANFSIHGVWSDYNNDRRPDLFIGNAGNQNDGLYTNLGGGSFSATVFTDGRASLGGSWGDYDNDGDLDLFVANFLNQKSFLYRNSGPPAYGLTRIDTGIVSNDAGNSVGSVWADFDNDGDLDLFVANDGHDNFYYRNSGHPHYSFDKVTGTPVTSDGGNSFGCAAEDYDNDGDLDLFVANRTVQKNFLYRNEGNGGHFLIARLIGSASNRSAIGTKVRLKATINGVPVWQMREVTSQSGYNSQTERIHFGTGNAAVIDSLVIEWPSGKTDRLVSVPADTIRTFVESAGPAGVRRSGGSIPGKIKLFQNYPNPFNPTTTVSYRSAGESFVSLKLYDLAGKMVALLDEGMKEAGEYSVNVDAEQHRLSAGMYFCTLTEGQFRETIRIVLTK